jgi:phage regulator Rha-like protein
LKSQFATSKIESFGIQIVMPKYQVREAIRIESLIRFVRGLRVMLDSDLARIYGVESKRLNEQVRRNIERFPADFAFRLTQAEFVDLTSRIAISKQGRGGRRKLPWAFTEHGAIMLASILNSDRAVQMSISVVRAFVGMREQLAAHKELAQKLSELENRVSGHDEAIQSLFEAIRQLVEPPLPEDRPKIGFMRETSPPYRFRKICRK